MIYVLKKYINMILFCDEIFDSNKGINRDDNFELNLRSLTLTLIRKRFFYKNKSKKKISLQLRID